VASPSNPRVLVTGSGGHLGRYVLNELQRMRGSVGYVSAWSGPHTATTEGLGGNRVDLTDAEQVERSLERDRPDVIFHGAAMSRVDQCHQQPSLAREVNTLATARLVKWAECHGARILLVSTDMVFDGTAAPYGEEATPQPLSEYGRTKWEAEQAVLAYHGGMVARVSLLFGTSNDGRETFFDRQLQAIRLQQHCRLFEDEWRTPLATHVAARALCRLGLSERSGLVHVGGPERMSRLEMGIRLARFLGCSADCIVATRQEDLTAPEPRPRDVSLDSGRFRNWFPEWKSPSYEQALDELLPGTPPPM
jgi:dTDP-4-dehydrorhamnose reductase